MVTVQLLSHEKRILASFITQTERNQVDMYDALAGLPETGAPLLIAMEQVFYMLNNRKVNENG